MFNKKNPRDRSKKSKREESPQNVLEMIKSNIESKATEEAIKEE